MFSEKELNERRYQLELILLQTRNETHFNFLMGLYFLGGPFLVSGILSGDDIATIVGLLVMVGSLILSKIRSPSLIQEANRIKDEYIQKYEKKDQEK
ncbi:MAG: hypothetical protein JRI56_09535 [Deltaproteobacteria bacterium]|nr:hypothetical protein [Deltaproteobacteria bacterium]